MVIILRVYCMGEAGMSWMSEWTSGVRARICMMRGECECVRTHGTLLTRVHYSRTAYSRVDEPTHVESPEEQ